MRNFDNTFFSLNDHHWLFDDSVDNNMLDLDVVFNLFSSDNFSFLDNFLNDSLNFHDLRNSDDLFNNFFNNNWNLD